MHIVHAGCYKRRSVSCRRKWTRYEHKRVRHQRPTDTSTQAMQDGLGGEILCMRRALRDVPRDDFPCTDATMMDTCNAPTLQAMVTGGTIRGQHDGRGAHTLDVTESPTSVAARTVELLVCFAITMYIVAGTTRERRAYTTNPYVSWFRAQIQGHERHGNWPPQAASAAGATIVARWRAMLSHSTTSGTRLHVAMLTVPSDIFQLSCGMMIK